MRALTAGFPVVILFAEVMGVVNDGVRHLGENAQIPAAGLDWPGLNGLVLHLRNSNNQRMTWKIASGALNAVFLYMNSVRQYGTVVFTVYDGVREVGRGEIA